MASMFGVNPDSFVRGALAGYVEYESTATTCLPAPTAKRSSVPVADSEMIRDGRCGIVTVPFAAFTCSGNGVAADAPPASSAATARTSGTIEILIQKPPR